MKNEKTKKMVVPSASLRARVRGIGGSRTRENMMHTKNIASIIGGKG